MRSACVANINNECNGRTLPYFTSPCTPDAILYILPLNSDDNVIVAECCIWTMCSNHRLNDCIVTFQSRIQFAAMHRNTHECTGACITVNRISWMKHSLVNYGMWRRFVCIEVYDTLTWHWFALQRGRGLCTYLNSYSYLPVHFENYISISFWRKMNKRGNVCKSSHISSIMNIRIYSIIHQLPRNRERLSAYTILVFVPTLVTLTILAFTYSFFHRLCLLRVATNNRPLVCWIKCVSEYRLIADVPEWIVFINHNS